MNKTQGRTATSSTRKRSILGRILDDSCMSGSDVIVQLTLATLATAPASAVIVGSATWLLSLAVGEVAYLVGFVVWLETVFFIVGIMFSNAGVANLRQHGWMNSVMFGGSTSLARLDEALKALPAKYARRLAVDVDSAVHDLIDGYLVAHEEAVKLLSSVRGDGTTSTGAATSNGDFDDVELRRLAALQEAAAQQAPSDQTDGG